MSTTKRLSVKAEKPQNQTFASKVQQLIGATLDDQTTGLSKSIDDAVLDSMVYGTGGVKIGGFTVTTTPFNGSSASITSPSWPRRVELKKETLTAHPAFELTTEQLRAAWMLAYGNRWMDMSEVHTDDYMNTVAARLNALGELEVHNVIDQYAPMARIKI